MLELGGTHWTGKESLVGTALVTNDNDMVLILGNFNARVGRDSLDWEGILGRHGVGSCNDNYMVLILGNFNARVGRDSLAWEGILGRHGVGN